MSTSERRARSAPPPGQAALEANEEAEASLVPRKDRRRKDKAETRAELQEPIPEDELEEVLVEELPVSSSVRVPTPPRVPDEHYISEDRRILDQPQPEVPEEIAAAAADAPAEESGNEKEVEWGDSLSSYSWIQPSLCAGVSAQAAPITRSCGIHEWVCSKPNPSFVARRQEAVSFLGRVQQLDTVACAPRGMADSTFPCERKRWAHALPPDNWQRLFTPSRHARRSSSRKSTDPEEQDAAKVDQRHMAR